MPDASLPFFLSDAAATEVLGRALARALANAMPRSGAVLYLEGEVGAGKTTCARSLLQTLGVSDPIRSPTYTLVDTYELDALLCVHVDLYRLQSASEVDELGLRELATPASLLLIEWPEKGGCAIPAADLVVRLSYIDELRSAHITAASEAGHSWLLKLGKDTSLKAYVSNLT